MPGLKQLQQFNSDIMTLGDEVKIRAARGEKPVIVNIPKDVKDIDDSDDFINGLPMLSEEEQAQADAAKKEREREANDFSEFLTDEKETEEEKSTVLPKQEAIVPDMSDLLPSGGQMDLGDFDLSDFEAPVTEKEEEPEPKEVAIEDMDLDSLLAFSEEAKEPEEQNFFEPQEKTQKKIETPTEEVSENLFNDEISNVSNNQTFDESLFDMPEAVELAEPLPEIDENSLMNSLSGIGELNEVPEEEIVNDNAPTLDEITNLPLEETESIKEEKEDSILQEPNKEEAEEIELPKEESFSTDDEITENEFFDAGDFDFSLGDESSEKSTPIDTETITEPTNESLASIDDSLDLPSFDEPTEVNEFSLTEGNLINEPPKYYEGKLDDPNEGFTTTESLSLNDDIPTEFNEIPDIENIVQSEDVEPQQDEIAEKEIPNLEDNSITLDSDDSSLSNSFDTTSLDIPDLGDLTADNALDTKDSDITSTLDLPETDLFSGDMGIDDLSSDENKELVATEKSLSPEDAVPEDNNSIESFDTSDINDLDFTGEENTDFALGSLDGEEGDDEFSIPGFSDTVTANLDNKPNVATPDFSDAAEADEKNKPKNTFTDIEYKKFLKNLATYPLNVRIALEDFVVKNEFTDDAIFSVLEKVLRKAPARQVATELEKLLDISLEVPRDFERRSAAEYEAYKKSIEYQLKNKIIPGAIMTAIAAILVFCIFTLSNTFIYKPIRASTLYKQGYSLLQESQYPQSEERFNQALTFKPVKKWFYTYAEGYRNHKQYDRSRMMYKAILKRYDHEKKAGLDWAHMEWEDLYNYEESERILKREILDFHINDADAILALGDMYLDWATDSNEEKYPLAKQNYDLLIELYGSNNLYLSRQMRYFIRTDNLRQVLMYKEIFMGQKKALQSADEIELSGYMLDKRFGKLRPSEENLRSQIEDVRKLLEKALKSAPEDAVALYNMGRYFVETNSGKNAARLLQASIDAFGIQTRRNKRDTYKYINSYRLLGEQMRNMREYLTAETLYGKGIDLFEKENASSRFESDENVGKLYADLADLDYFIAADNDAALMHYESAVNNKYDTSSVRYRIGYIQYQKQNYPAALGSFIKSHDTSGNDIHLLLALANTLSLSSDNYVARGYYERLLSILDGERQRYGILFPQVRDDQGDIVDTYMKASNNLGVTLSRIATNTGDSSLNAKAIVNLQESLRAWDALTRNQKTMIRLEGSNLAEQNVRYITHPMPDYNPEIYTEIHRMLFGEKGLE